MAKEKHVLLTNIVPSGLCIASDDGEKVYLEISNALKEEYQVFISFEGVKDLNSAFLNAAIGQLYKGEIKWDAIRKNLKTKNATQENLHLIKRVVERAKAFFREPERFVNATKEALGDGDRD